MRGHSDHGKTFARSRRITVFSLLAMLMIANAIGQPAAPTTTNAEVAALLREIQHNNIWINPIVWNTNGELVTVSLPRSEATDSNILMLSQIYSIQTLRIQGFTIDGSDALHGFTNLMALNLACGGRMSSGVFEHIGRIHGLRQLSLWGIYPSREEYTNLLALTNLEEFANTACTNFGPQELKLLTNLTRLKSIRLELSNATRQQDTNVLSNLKYLTNLSVYFQRP